VVSPRRSSRGGGLARLCLAVRLQSQGAVGVAPRLRHGVQNVSGITTRQGELFPGAEPGPQFYPVSAIDYLTGYLMAFGAMVALRAAPAKAAAGSSAFRWRRRGAGWLIAARCPRPPSRTSRKRSRKPRSDRWSIESDTPAGRLRHLGQTVRLSETRPVARPSVPLGYNEPAWPARAA